MSDYSKEQLIDALVHEWDYLCHDDYDPQDPSPEEYRKEMELLTVEELIEETSTGEGYVKTNEFGMFKLVNREQFSYANFNNGRFANV